MGRLKLYLFGAPHLSVEGRIINVRLRKVLALLAYLCVTRRPHTRDGLAALFWSEADPQTGRADLRRAIYNLKKIIGPDLLTVSAESIGIRDGADLWLDVAAFRKRSALPAAGEGRGRDALRRMEEASQLYGGEFMAGFSLADCPEFDEWQFFQREHWHGAVLGVMDELISAYEAAQAFKAAIACARRRLSFDRLHEATHRRLMRLYHRTGEKAAAVRQYGLCKRLLMAELNAAPQRETVDLYRTLRMDRRTDASAHSPSTPRTRYVKSGGTYIAYQQLGSGSMDVLFVPGFVSHIEHVWQQPDLAAFYRRIAESARLILFDRRGIGLSDRTGAPPHVAHTVEDMHAVLASSGSGRTLLIGASEGGPAIIRYAIQHPQQCRGLVLYGTMAKGTRSENYPHALTREQYDRWLSKLTAAWGGPAGIEHFAPSRAHDQALRKWWAALLRLSSSPGNVRLVLEALRDIDVRSLLPGITVPTLILHRTADRSVPVDAGRYLARHIPGNTHVELEGSDHWWWVGDSHAIIRQIEAFINVLASSPDRPA